MKAALVSAWAGFALGLLVGFLSSIWPSSFFTLGCAFCFGFDFDAGRIFVAGMALVLTLMNGALYGLIGLTVAFTISKARTQTP